MPRKVRGIFKHPPHIDNAVRKEGRATYFECFTADNMDMARAMAQERANGMGLPVHMVVGGLKYVFMPESQK